MSAEHDQIVKWIEDHMQEITARYLEPSWSDQERAIWSAYSSTPLPEPRITWKCEWERPISVSPRLGSAPKIEGYIDLQAVVSRNEVYVERVQRARPSSALQPGPPPGFPGHTPPPPIEHIEVAKLCSRSEVWNFEAKTRIDSVGDVIRQIKRYRFFLPSHSKFFVVSPDSRNAAIFEAQGIVFIEAFAGQGRLQV